MGKRASVFKRLLDSSVMERVAAVISLLYFIGIIILILFNSIFVGDFDFDFVRVKPIIVGIQYLLYLSLPLIVIFLPVVLTSQRCFGWFWEWLYAKKRRTWKTVVAITLRVLFCLFGSFVLFFLIGEMFHYFVPYTEYLYSSDNFCFSLLQISYAFWLLYASWDVNLIAFACLLVLGLLWALRYCRVCSFKTTAANRFYWCMFVPLVLLGFFGNMFYFTRDVYLNISQAAAGGAPMSGIITITSPSEQMKRGLDGVVRDCDEVTKFCSIMQIDNEYLYVDDQLVGDRGVLGGTKTRTRVNSTRVKREYVKQFTPLKIPMRYQYGCREVFPTEIMRGLVHNIDMFVEFKLSASSAELAAQIPRVFNVTNKIEAAWFGDDFPRSVIYSTHQRIVNENLTNLCYTVEFHDMPVPSGTLVSEFCSCLSMKSSYVDLMIRNLPPLPKGLSSTQWTVGFLVDYFLPVSWMTEIGSRYGWEIKLNRKLEFYCPKLPPFNERK